MVNIKKSVAFLALLSLGLFAVPASAATVDLNFDLNPRVITFPSTKITYTIKVTVNDYSSLRRTCGDNSDIKAYITVAGRMETWKITDFLATPTQTRTGDFIAEARGSTGITYPVRVYCGLGGGGTTLAQSSLSLPVTGQPGQGSVLGLNFDVNPKTISTATANFDFKQEFIGSQSKLDEYCGAGGNIIWTVYRLPISSPNFSRENEVRQGAIPHSEFGAGKTLKRDFAQSVTAPKSNFYFQSRATCTNGKVITTSGPTPQGGIAIGGVPTTDPKNPGDTSSKSYSFEIKNPLVGAPENIFDVINIATKWLLNIAIPLAVLFILWAGFLMITAGSTPAKYEKGKKILFNVVVGLAIIFIGRGFITLIYSVLELGTESSETSVETQSATSSIGLGLACSRDSDCNSGLTCKNKLCSRKGGNGQGEPCTSNQCAQGFACDNTQEAQQTIGGRTVGSCFRVLCQPDPNGSSLKFCIDGPREGSSCTTTADCE